MNSYKVLEKQLKAQQARQIEDGQEGAYPWALGSVSDRRSSMYSDVESHCMTDPLSLHTETGDFLSVYGGGGGSIYGLGWRKTPLSRRTSNWSVESVETDLDISVETWSGGDCTYIYLAACRQYNEVPISCIKESLQLRELKLSHQNLEPMSTKALCIALAVNSCVCELDVSHNRVGQSGLGYITEMMLHNPRITNLNVSHNEIGAVGLKTLTVLLRKNKSVKHLKAAGNRFGDINKHAAQFTRSIQNNIVLESLDLGYNAIGQESGPYWAHVIGNNYGLRKLTLRWNHLRWRGVNVILRALQLNETLQVLDLAWNGVADEGCHILGGILLYNTVLRELDLTCNRITLEGCLCLCQGLLRNTTLKVLKISKNPITTNGCISLLETYQENEESALKRLELLDIEVDRYFEGVLEEIQESDRPLEVLHGGHVIHGDVYLQNGKRKRPLLGDPLNLLFEHVKNSNLRLWDLFAQFDKDKSLSISRDEFRNGMKEARLPLDDFQIERIINTLDKDKNGEITFEELLEGYKRYREKERKKYETLLPFILQRPSSARQDTQKDENAPIPRSRADIISMQGSVGESSKIERKSTILPEISLTEDADYSSKTTRSQSRTYTLLPQINITEAQPADPFQTTSSLYEDSYVTVKDVPVSRSFERHDSGSFRTQSDSFTSFQPQPGRRMSLDGVAQESGFKSTPQMPVIGETSQFETIQTAEVDVNSDNQTNIHLTVESSRVIPTYSELFKHERKSLKDLRQLAMRRGSHDSAGISLGHMQRNPKKDIHPRSKERSDSYPDIQKQ